MNARCEKCRYFVEADDEVGDCQRYAPKPKWSFEIPEGQSDSLPFWRVMWPEVRRLHFCGEFKQGKT